MNEERAFRDPAADSPGEIDDLGSHFELVPEELVPDGDVDGEAPEDDLLADLDGSEEAAGTTERKSSSLLEAMVLVLLALVLALSLKSYVAEAYEIKGKSMEPTFHNGERVVVLKVLYEVERGDIIIFKSRNDPGKDLIKRVVGLPGDRIHFVEGTVFVNGEEIEESYLDPDDRVCCGSEPEYVVGPDEYYVLGDNRRDSHDSRRFSGVPKENVKGKVVVRWWPFDEIQSF